MKIRVVIGLLFAVGVLATSYLYMLPRLNNLIKTENDFSTNTNLQPSQSAVRNSGDEKRDKPISEGQLPIKNLNDGLHNNNPGTLAGTPAEVAIVKKWSESRGRYGPDDESLKEYATYNLETLEKLAEAGDLKAMTALSWLYLSNERYGREDALEKHENNLYRAALYGSTYALAQYSTLAERSEPGTGAIKYENLIESLAWAQLAAMRGDLWPSHNSLIRAEIHKFEFTNEAVVQIKQRAHELYGQLERQRIEMGLGEFDNSRPPEVDNLFNNIGEFMPIPE